MANEVLFASLDRRTILGLGTARNTAKQHAANVGLLTQMREALTIVRGLLDGEEVSFAGQMYTLKPTRLGSPPRKGLPIYIGTYASSPRTCQLTGELADGIIDFAPTPDFVRLGSQLLAEGPSAATEIRAKSTTRHFSSSRLTMMKNRPAAT